MTVRLRGSFKLRNDERAHSTLVPRSKHPRLLWQRVPLGDYVRRKGASVYGFERHSLQLFIIRRRDGETVAFI
uniref:Uncharacterized protein n=1 Tax=Ralstonia solanacearum TaxID=305 RepID=A0A0S4V0K7_RALSL|nr:protein of unknown function [Ralstonia solanacearum]